MVDRRVCTKTRGKGGNVWSIKEMFREISVVETKGGIFFWFVYSLGFGVYGVELGKIGEIRSKDKYRSVRETSRRNNIPDQLQCLANAIR